MRKVVTPCYVTVTLLSKFESPIWFLTSQSYPPSEQPGHTRASLLRRPPSQTRIFGSRLHLRVPSHHPSILPRLLGTVPSAPRLFDHNSAFAPETTIACCNPDRNPLFLLNRTFCCALGLRLLNMADSPDGTDSVAESVDENQLTIRIPNPKHYMARQSQWKGRRGKPRCDHCRVNNLKVCVQLLSVVLPHIPPASVTGCYLRATTARGQMAGIASIHRYPLLRTEVFHDATAVVRRISRCVTPLPLVRVHSLTFLIVRPQSPCVQPLFGRK